MANSILMVAYHYPPFSGSSGIHRTLNFSRHLSRLGWKVTVLSICCTAYPSIRNDLISQIPPDVEVYRAWGIDTARHLAVRGAYLKWMAIPDRWVSWCLGAVALGTWIILRKRPAVLWSTYPIATAHLIGFLLHGLSSIPWVADFRDSMTETGYPADPTVWKAFRWIEQKTMQYCTKAVFTAPGAIKMYQERYPEVPADRFALIENGYDEDSFSVAEQLVSSKQKKGGVPLQLVHSGLLYPSERDPRPFFNAIAELRDRGEVGPETVKIVLRASGYELEYGKCLDDLGIADIIHLESALPYHQALAEMLTSDALLLFQASNCNHQIPAKVYEYIRARRPILAFVDPKGDTAKLLRKVGVNSFALLNSKEDIVKKIPEFLDSLRKGCASMPNPRFVKCYSRWNQTIELNKLLIEMSHQN